MLKFVKALLFIVASGIMGVCVYFVPEISGNVSISFVFVLSMYLGIDIADTIKKSSEMKKGDFKPIHIHKYVISAVCLVCLIGVSIYMKSKGIDVSAAMTSFITSSLVIIGMLIGALEGNKIAANVDGETK